MMLSFAPVGWVESPFAEKFAVPRQSALVRHGIFRIRFHPPYNVADAFTGIEGFSHLWVLFNFDRIPESQGFQPRVRPPRLGGNRTVGVFASRSPFRPNRIGLSLVKLRETGEDSQGFYLSISGADLVTGTPVLDIKPYIRFTDSVPDAISGFAEEPPVNMEVVFTPEAERAVEASGIPEFRELIAEVLAQDPRPAYRHGISDDDRIYGVQLYDRNVRWRVSGNRAEVIAAERI